MLTSHSGLPEVSETSVESHLLHSLEILAHHTVQQVRVLVRRLAVLDVLRSVQEPQRDLELLGVGDDRDDLGDLLLGQLTRALVHIDVALLADQVGESSTNTLKRTRICQLAKLRSYLDSSQSEHDLMLTINVRIANTKDVLEVRRLHTDRHP